MGRALKNVLSRNAICLRSVLTVLGLDSRAGADLYTVQGCLRAEVQIQDSNLDWMYRSTAGVGSRDHLTRHPVLLPFLQSCTLVQA